MLAEPGHAVITRQDSRATLEGRAVAERVTGQVEIDGTDATDDGRLVWSNPRWRLTLSADTGLPVMLVLGPLEHHDLPSLFRGMPLDEETRHKNSGAQPAHQLPVDAAVLRFPDSERVGIRRARAPRAAAARATPDGTY